MDLDSNNEISFDEFVAFVSNAEGEEQASGSVTKQKSKEGKEIT